MGRKGEHNSVPSSNFHVILIIYMPENRGTKKVCIAMELYRNNQIARKHGNSTNSYRYVTKVSNISSKDIKGLISSTSYWKHKVLSLI